MEGSVLNLQRYLSARLEKRLYMAEARFLSSPILYGSCFWHRNGNCKFIDGASALHNDNRHSIWQEVFQDYETGVNAIWRKSKILFPTGIRCFSSV